MLSAIIPHNANMDRHSQEPSEVQPKALSSRSLGIFSSKEQFTVNLLLEFLYVRHFNFLRTIRSLPTILSFIDSNFVLLSFGSAKIYRCPHSRGEVEEHPGFTDTALQTSEMSGWLLLPFIISSC